MYPAELKYTEEHEWVRVEGNVARVGITDFAQKELGDVVFVELPGVGDSIKAAESLGVVESVKAVSDIYSPVSGQIVKVNEKLEDSPELINQDPYGEGWIAEIEVEDPKELEGLLTAEEYQAIVEG
ncbi:MAG: glycine cleavage system protein GcvH [Limnochordia bacterium]|jgi:glycine cleavage system H protein|nr:glycine cleavage system protein GcvH [Bacillota bacterium]